MVWVLIFFHLWFPVYPLTLHFNIFMSTWVFFDFQPGRLEGSASLGLLDVLTSEVRLVQKVAPDEQWFFNSPLVGWVILWDEHFTHLYRGYNKAKYNKDPFFDQPGCFSWNVTVMSGGFWPQRSGGSILERRWKVTWVVATQRCLIFKPYPWGFMIQFDLRIFFFKWVGLIQPPTRNLFFVGWIFSMFQSFRPSEASKA